MDLEFLTLCSNSYNSYTSTSAYLYILWLFNIAMENGPFIDDFPIKTSIYKGFSMAMLNNQMVILLFYSNYSSEFWGTQLGRVSSHAQNQPRNEANTFMTNR